MTETTTKKRQQEIGRVLAIRGMKNGLSMLTAGLEVLNDLALLADRPDVLPDWPRRDLGIHAGELSSLALTLSEQLEHVEKFVLEEQQPKPKRVKKNSSCGPRLVSPAPTSVQ